MNTNQTKLVFDLITTIGRGIIATVSLIGAIVFIVTSHELTTKTGTFFEDMPSGEGPADGYLVIGKFFGGAASAFGGIVLMIFAMGLIMLFLISAVAIGYYIYNRVQFEKTAQGKYLRSNFIIKIVLNTLNLILLAANLGDLGTLASNIAVIFLVIFVVVEIFLVRYLVR